MSEQQQIPPSRRFSWPVFAAVIIIVVLCLLAIYFFVYLRVGA